MAELEGLRPIASSIKTCMLIFGRSGIGKTRLIGSGPNTLILHPPTDHMDSIRGGDAQEKVINDWDDMTEAYEYLRHGGHANHDWVWLDSISLFQDTGLDDIWEGVIADKPHRAKHGADKGEYGINMQRLARWVRHMVGLPGFNFGITAHQADLVDESDNALLMPYVQGKNMSNKICGYMNVVAYLEMVKDKRVLRTATTDRYYAKDQYDAFPNARMVEPTMPKIIAAIEASRNGKGTTKRRPARRRTATRSK
jgi:hypothetical protein